MNAGTMGLFFLPFSVFLTITHSHTGLHTRTDPWLMCDVVMQNFLRLSTNAESMHMFDLL